MTKIDYDVKEGFVADDGSNGLKEPRTEDWKFETTGRHDMLSGNFVDYKVFVNSRSGYAIAVISEEDKVMSRSYAGLEAKVTEWFKN